MTERRRPRRRPPWWPEDETWPPADWQHRRHGRPLFFRFGCAFLVLALFIGVTFNVAVLVLANILGQTTDPQPLGRLALAAILIFAGLGAIFAFRGVRRMTQPLDNLSDAAEKIERGDYSARVAEDGPQRVRALARTFNAMSARLESVDQTRRAFLADVAHELRTPLSVVAAQLEAIEDGLYPADAAHLAPIHEQLQLMEKLIDDLRTVALAEAGGLTLNWQPLEIGALLDHTISDFQPEAQASEIELATDFPPGLPVVTADEQRVRQVLANLIGNALRHTHAGGHVWVSASVGTARDSIQVTVRDDGSGIPADLLRNVFERFTREPRSTGSGLGLAISKDLVEAHGGTIGIGSDSGTGTTVTFTLPL